MQKKNYLIKWMIGAKELMELLALHNHAFNHKLLLNKLNNKLWNFYFSTFKIMNLEPFHLQEILFTWIDNFYANKCLNSLIS